MPTFTKKYLKDKDGNYLAPASLAELIQHNDGETTEVKMQVVEDKLGTGVLDTVAQDMTGAINELKPIADEVITARTDANGTYNTLDERLDAMDVKIAAAGGGGNIDLSNYQTKEDTTLQTTSKQVVGAINEVHSEMLTVEDFVGNGTTTNDVVAKVATLEVNTNALMQEIEVARTSTDGTVHNTLGQRLDSIEDDFLPLTGGQMTGNIKLTNNNALITGLTTAGAEVKVAQVADNDTVYIGDETIPTYVKGTQTSILQPTTVHGKLTVVTDDIRVTGNDLVGYAIGGATDAASGISHSYVAPIVNNTPKWNNAIRYYDKLYQSSNINGPFTQEVFTFGASLCPNNGENAVRNLGSEEVSYAKWTNIFLTGCVVANNGVIKLPNKTLMQWGTIDLTITTGTATKQLVTLPTQFPNGCLYAQANVDYNISSSPNAGGRYWDVAYLTANVSIESAATIMVHLADPGNKIPGGDRTYRVTWMAFGY